RARDLSYSLGTLVRRGEGKPQKHIEALDTARRASGGCSYASYHPAPSYIRPYGIRLWIQPNDTRGAGDDGGDCAQCHVLLVKFFLLCLWKNRSVDKGIWPLYSPFHCVSMVLYSVVGFPWLGRAYCGGEGGLYIKHGLTSGGSEKLRGKVSQMPLYWQGCQWGK